MKIALCASREKAKALKGQLVRGLPYKTHTVDLFKTSKTCIRGVVEKKYDIVWVALEGAIGLETVIALREKLPNIKIVWMSEDRHFALIGYRLGIEMFLMWDCTQEEITQALEMGEKEERR